ncbi:MAG: glucose 1-dehydrogenase [Planctomycetota bacterium]|jgi:gluconate 5-dehydrogenase
MSDFNLTGKRALVTGGSKGIGFAIAQSMAKAGADIVLLARNEETLKDAAAKLADTGRKISSYQFDMCDTGKIQDCFSEIVKECGGVDILVNNAGASRRGPAEEISSEDWDFVLNLNLKSVFVLSQEFVKHCMAEDKGGKIVNISSLMGEAVRKDNAPYAASKGAIRQLTMSMAVDWAQYGINVNAIGPGYIKTDLNVNLQEDPEFDAWVLKRTPAGRWGMPDDISGTAVFLASPAADFITGQNLYVDGGLLACF